jgi:hypothetical protein
MRTAIILGIGFVLMAALVGAGWLLGGAPRVKLAVLVFIGLWFIATATNLYIGVSRAGYSFMEELPIFLLLFGVPAIVAMVLRSRF